MRISVVVPVYNAEKYIKRCISSVYNQTFSNWELILVDDGSKDRSADILDLAARKDERIRVIHQSNAGPGMARNRGIEEASGDFVVFLDADDLLDKNYFELLSYETEKNDLVFIDVIQVSATGGVLAKELMSVYRDWNKEDILRAQMTGKILWGGVRKAISLELLRKNNIKFTEHNVGEEALYSFKAVHAAKSIGFITEKPVYFYVNHEGSQSKTRTSDPWGPVVECLKEYLEQMGLYKEYANTLNAFNFTATLVSLDKIEQMYNGKKKKEISRKRMDKFRTIYDKTAGIDYKSMSLKAKLFLPFIKQGILWPIFVCSRLRYNIKKAIRKI